MDYLKNKKLIFLTGVLVFLGTATIVYGTPPDITAPLWEHIWKVEEPVTIDDGNGSITIDGNIGLTNNEVVVSNYTGDPLEVTGTVELADGTEVSIDSLTDVKIKVDTDYQMVFDTVEVPPLSSNERVYFDIDGYKTIHIWCLVGLTGDPLVDIDFSYPGVGALRQVDTYTTTTFGTYSVSAPEISFQIYNNHATDNAYVTVIFYAQGI